MCSCRDREILFLDDAEAVEYLSAEDDYIETMVSLNRFGSEDEIHRHFGNICLDWSDGEREGIRQELSAVLKRVEDFNLRLPPSISLIKIDGPGFAHTRGSALVLSGSFLSIKDIDYREKVLVHEVFHLYSTYNPSERDALYSLAGFIPGPPLAVPAELRERLIVNPDAPSIRWFLPSSPGREQIFFAPITYLGKDLETVDTDSFFDEINYGFLEVDVGDRRTEAKYRNGNLTILSADEISDFEYQTGISGYLIDKTEHPEELLATIFTLMVFDIHDNLRFQKKLRHYLID